MCPTWESVGEAHAGVGRGEQQVRQVQQSVKGSQTQQGR